MTTLARFGRFNLASGLGIGVQLAVLWALVHVFSTGYLVATVVAVLAAVAHNFVWHWQWTWADRALPRTAAPSALLRFAVANGCVSLAGNLAIMAGLVSVMHVPPVAANLVAIAACGLINFRLSDRVVFRPCRT